ncbi:caspase recruitment domain-containing protein 8-like isoform x14 [Limosa lapponica baueri]|uniref:Caspase recruitment domain-containing protein 8-like isoform x14 n=1 Tax=Limosa lapponica baueri TaxID=1758121 RepID=A0A2I0TZH1_LIMLA|nr:caspase recruitment domain-containing protein 8-like isoform x14 [Limosa lapponica baueri]
MAEWEVADDSPGVLLMELLEEPSLEVRGGGETIKAQSSEESSPFCEANSARAASLFKFMGREIPLAHIPNLLSLDLPKVIPITHWDVLAKRLVYRADLPRAGIFQCSLTGLSFQVKSAVTITYRYDTWTEHLSEADWETWVPAGPLFHIEVQPGVVQAVHLPHFICLADVNTSLCSIAHFKSGEMTLERPTRLIAFSAVLENPSFSLLGVLWRRLRSALNSLPMHSSVLIFQQSNAANTFRFYLIPDDNSVKQAIKKEEMECDSKFIPKPPPFKPLFFGCDYQVTTTKPAQITPETRLPFCYRSPKKQQLYVEIYIENMAEEIGLLMTDTRDGIEVWRASLRSGRNSSTVTWALCLLGPAFMKENKTVLCSRMGQLPTILMYLRDANVINSDEEEEVQRQDTRRKRNQILLKLVEKKGRKAQEQLYQILWRQDPCLMEDLELS